MFIRNVSDSDTGLDEAQIREHVLNVLEGMECERCLILSPDYSRLYSNGGLITNIIYHELASRGCIVDIMPALGTHAPMTDREVSLMFGDVPKDRFIVHNWRDDVVKLGEVPGTLISEWTEGIWTEPVSVEVNRRLVSGEYDLILSVGQVVPHEVAGMSNYTKNIFVGAGGSDMINKSHMVGGLYGLERIMGRTDSPVRKLYDYGLEHFLNDAPIFFIMTVCTVTGEKISTHGIFSGNERRAYEEACSLSVSRNTFLLERPIRKCVVYLNPAEYKTTWIGNKAIYRTRMAIADGGELIILAPGVAGFGEDPQIDTLIRKYGYTGREHILELFRKPECSDLRANMGGTAHLVHGSSDGRFRITYAVKNISKEEIESVGFNAADYDSMAKIYDPASLVPGFQTVNGEEIFFVENPMMGLWFEKSRI